MTAQTNLSTILRGAGCKVSEVSGWKTRGHGTDLTPAGITWHHTAGHNDLNTCINGRSDLAGPLCNLYLDQDGVWSVVAAGVAYHAGPMSKRVMDEIAAGKPCPGDAKARGLPDDYSAGNHRLLGIECEGGRAGEAWPAVQIAALVKGSAALCRAHGWTANHCRHHREQTARKIDMSYRGDLRAAVTDVLGDDMPSAEEVAAETLHLEWGTKNFQRSDGSMTYRDSALRAILDKVFELDARLNAIDDKITALGAK